MGTAQATELLSRIERFWQSGERHAVLITGFTADDVIIGEHEGRLFDVLAAHFAARFDVVLLYSLASGLHASHGAESLHNHELRSHLPLENALPADALRVARELLSTEQELRITLLIDAVEDLVSTGATSGPAERAALQQLERIADDPRIVASESLVVAITADPAPSLGRLMQPYSRWLVEAVPPADEAALYSAATDVMSLECAPELDGLTVAEVARLSSGMSVAALKHGLLSAERVDAGVIHRLRAESVLNAAGGLLEVVEPLPGGWAAVPGLDHVRTALSELVRPDGTVHPYGRDGILLAGPPGCGKSTVIRAFAAERPMPWFVLGDFRSRWVGASEQNLTRLFALLRSFAPCGVFKDEFDQMVGRRGDDDSGTHEVDRRSLGKLLQFMEETRRSGEIVWVGATNRPASIDEAMLSRLGRVLPVLLPGPRARAQIMQAIADSFELDHGDVDWRRIAELLPNTASRDLERIVRRAGQEMSGHLGHDGVIRVVADARPTRGLDQVHRWSLQAIEHVRFASDLPSLDDLPEHLEGVSF